MTWTHGRGDAGESLVEVMVATAIMGTTMVAIVGGFLALNKISAEQKDQGKVFSALVSGSEYAKTRACGKTCAAEANVPSASVPRDSDVTVAVSAPSTQVFGGSGTALTKYVVTVSTDDTSFANTVVLR